MGASGSAGISLYLKAAAHTWHGQSHDPFRRLPEMGTGLAQHTLGDSQHAWAKMQLVYLEGSGHFAVTMSEGKVLFSDLQKKSERSVQAATCDFIPCAQVCPSEPDMC